MKLNYCPLLLYALFKNLPQIQIKIFKLTSLSWYIMHSWTLPKPLSLTKFHINDFYTNSNFVEWNIKLDLCLFIKPYTNSGSGWRVIRYCSSHFWCPTGNSSGSCSFSGIYKWLTRILYLKSSQLRLFADDSIIYKTIKSQKDCDSLQEDLDAAARWERDWLMAFHPHKCTVLTIAILNKNEIVNSFNHKSYFCLALLVNML